MLLIPTDITIIAAYFVLTIMVGLYFTRLASRNINSYFLGRRRMPWYILCIQASGMKATTG